MHNIYELMNMYVLMHIFLIMLGVYTFAKLSKDIVTVLESRFYRFIILMFVIYVVTAAVWSLFEYGMINFPLWVFYLNSSLSYLALALIAYGLFVFVMLRHGFKLISKKSYRYLSAIPVAIVTILLIINCFVHFLFTVTPGEGNVKTIDVKTSFAPVLILSIAYFVIILSVSVYKGMKTKSIPKRREYSWLAVAMSLVLLCVVMNGLMFKKLTILPMAVFVTIYTTFTNLQETGINNDALTGLNNRRRANEYLKEQLSLATEQQPLALFVCDINSFKAINDVYGHLEGDNALLIVSDSIRMIAQEYSGFAARFGGDEFVLSIKPNAVKNGGFQPEKIVREIAKSLVDSCEKEKKPYSLSVSVGYVICKDPRKPLGFYFVKADEMLYKVKREFHENEKAAGN